MSIYQSHLRFELWSIEFEILGCQQFKAERNVQLLSVFFFILILLQFHNKNRRFQTHYREGADDSIL